MVKAKHNTTIAQSLRWVGMRLNTEIKKDVTLDSLKIGPNTKGMIIEEKSYTENDGHKLVYGESIDGVEK